MYQCLFLYSWHFCDPKEIVAHAKVLKLFSSVFFQKVLAFMRRTVVHFCAKSEPKVEVQVFFYMDIQLFLHRL